MATRTVEMILRQVAKCTETVQGIRDEVARQAQRRRQLPTSQEQYKDPITRPEQRMLAEIDRVVKLNRAVRKICEVSADRELMQDGIKAVDQWVTQLNMVVCWNMIDRQNAYLFWMAGKSKWELYEPWVVWSKRNSSLECKSDMSLPCHSDLDILSVAKIRELLILKHCELQEMKYNQKCVPLKMLEELSNLYVELKMAQEKHEEIMWNYMEDRRAKYLLEYVPKAMDSNDKIFGSLYDNLSQKERNERITKDLSMLLVTFGWMSMSPTSQGRGQDAQGQYQTSKLYPNIEKTWFELKIRIALLEARISNNGVRHHLRECKFTREMQEKLIDMLTELTHIRMEIKSEEQKLVVSQVSNPEPASECPEPEPEWQQGLQDLEELIKMSSPVEDAVQDFDADFEKMELEGQGALQWHGEEPKDRNPPSQSENHHSPSSLKSSVQLQRSAAPVDVKNSGPFGLPLIQEEAEEGEGPLEDDQDEETGDEIDDNRSGDDRAKPYDSAETRFRALLRDQRRQMFKLVDDLARERSLEVAHVNVFRLTQHELRQIQQQHQDLNAVAVRRLLEQQRVQQLNLFDKLLSEDNRKTPTPPTPLQVLPSTINEHDFDLEPTFLEGVWLQGLMSGLMSTGNPETKLKASGGGIIPTLNTTTISFGRKVTTV